MARIAVNSHQTVPAGGYGRCTYMSPSVVRKAVSDGTAVAGTLWGPKVSSWELHLNEAGFSSLGGDIGPVALFSRKTGVGSAGGAVLAQTSLIIPARQGNFLLGGPTEVQPVTHDGAGVVSNFGDPINVWSWVRSPSADPNDEPTGYLYVWIELGSDGFWYWTGEDCPVIDQGDPQQIQQSGFQMTGNTNTLIIAPP